MPTYMQPQYFLPLFAAMWFGVTGLLAHFGGWAYFGRTYKSDGRVEGDRFRFVSGSMGNRFFPVNYGNCLFVTVTPHGVGISILFPFRFQCPPLYFPWTDVESVVEKRFLFLFPYTVVTIRNHWPRISLWGGAGKAVMSSYGAR
jgi:hypothetical protein